VVEFNKTTELASRTHQEGRMTILETGGQTEWWVDVGVAHDGVQQRRDSFPIE
jgi:hypothetical protein